jgi:hypothetical protein
MEVEVYSFPTMENPKAVEVTYCKLLNAQRRGETIPVEAVDWMDSANTWLIESRGSVT